MGEPIVLPYLFHSLMAQHPDGTAHDVDALEVDAAPPELGVDDTETAVAADGDALAPVAWDGDTPAPEAPDEPHWDAWADQAGRYQEARVGTGLPVGFPAGLPVGFSAGLPVGDRPFGLITGLPTPLQLASTPEGPDSPSADGPGPTDPASQRESPSLEAMAARASQAGTPAAEIRRTITTLAQLVRDPDELPALLAPVFANLLTTLRADNLIGSGPGEGLITLATQLYLHGNGKALGEWLDFFEACHYTSTDQRQRATLARPTLMLASKVAIHKAWSGFARLAVIQTWQREPGRLIALVHDAYLDEWPTIKEVRVGTIRRQLSPLTREIVAFDRLEEAALALHSVAPNALFSKVLTAVVPPAATTRRRSSSLRQLWQQAPQLFYLILAHELGVMAEGQASAGQRSVMRDRANNCFLDHIKAALPSNDDVAAVLECRPEHLVFTAPGFKARFFQSFQYSQNIMTSWLHDLANHATTVPASHPIRVIVRGWLHELIGGYGLLTYFPFHRCHGLNETAIKVAFTAVYVGEIERAAAGRRAAGYLPAVLRDLAVVPTGSLPEPDLFDALILATPPAVWLKWPEAARQVFTRSAPARPGVPTPRDPASLELNRLGKRYFAAPDTRTVAFDPVERARAAAAHRVVAGLQRRLLAPSDDPGRTP